MSYKKNINHNFNNKFAIVKSFP